MSKPALKRFAVNVASLFSVQLANTLLPLLTVPYVVRVIGPERLGLLNFSQAYVAYFILIISYGFDMAAVRSIAANRTDKEAMNRVFSEVIAGKLLLWVVSTVVFAVVSANVPEFRQHLWLHVCTYIICISTVLSPFWLYQAMEDLGRVAVFNLAIKILFLLSVFLLIREADDYIFQNLAISVSQVLINVVALYVAMRRFRVRFTWPSMPRLVGRFRDDSTLFFSSVMITLYASSNVFFLGLLSSPYNVGIFSAGTRLEGIARSFVALALNQAFFPIVASAFGQSREQGIRLVRTAFLPLFLLMTVVSAGLWLTAPLFVTILYGDKFGDAVQVLRIVSLLPITIGISNLLGIHTMLNLRMDRAFFVITAIGSVIGIVLNVVLIRQFGHIGAAYAWVLAELYTVIAMYGFLRYKGIEIIRIQELREAIAFGRERFHAFTSK